MMLLASKFSVEVIMGICKNSTALGLQGHSSEMLVNAEALSNVYLGHGYGLKVRLG